MFQIVGFRNALQVNMLVVHLLQFVLAVTFSVKNAKLIQAIAYFAQEILELHQVVTA